MTGTPQQHPPTPTLVPNTNKKFIITIIVGAIVVLSLVTFGVLLREGFIWYIWIIPLCFCVLGLFYLGYTSFKWTGFGDYISPAYTKNTHFQRSKTLWDWLQLLIIPVVLASGAIWFNLQQNQNNQLFNEQQHTIDKLIAKDNQHETILNNFMDGMSNLLLNDNLQGSHAGAEVRQVARAKTLAALFDLDGRRKGVLVRFLYEAGLIYKNNVIIDLKLANLSSIELNDANLQNVDMSGANLMSAQLHGSNLNGADLNSADLTQADLSNASLNNAQLSDTILVQTNLSEVNLSSANLTNANLESASLVYSILNFTILQRADLYKAILSDANLSNADLRFSNLGSAQLDYVVLKQAKAGNADLNNAILTNAILSGADLSHDDLDHANLSNASLNGADLSYADISHATITKAQLDTTKSLKGLIQS